ncbi:MAG: ATP-dependent nuclease [Gammaproteobacteria bacterium]
MHLKKLKLKDFRSCKETTIEFQKSITVLVGENNSGKSNILDALRLLFKPLNERPDRWCEDDDIHLSSSEKKFEITGYIDELNSIQKALLITALSNPSSGEAVFGIEFLKSDISSGRPRGKTRYWVGESKNNESEPDARNSIRYVYLPALRDAQQALSSSKGSRIKLLLQYLSSEKDVTDFIEKTRSSYIELEKNTVIQKPSVEISKKLSELTIGAIPHHSALGFIEADLFNIARDLRFKLSREGLDPKDLSYSGLGYANLLYIASVLVELLETKQADLSLLLVEEPEAHLHPQLQAILLEILNEYISSPRASKDDEPEGNIQIIISTHSPNLISSIELNKIVVLPYIDPIDNIENTTGIALASFNFSNREKRKIERYLDVTKSSLLFARRVLLVEGISEAIIIPVIAKFKMFINIKDKKQIFNGSTIVAINGVDFSPYVKLLKNEIGNIAKSVVIISDDDTKPGNKQNESRKGSINQLKNSIGNANVFTANYTFEAEIFSANQTDLLKEIYLEIHPKSNKKWNESIEIQAELNTKIINFVELIRDDKGEFSNLLAEKIEENPDGFTVPSYLEDAIKKLVEIQ